MFPFLHSPSPFFPFFALVSTFSTNSHWKSLLPRLQTTPICHGLWGWVGRVPHWGPIYPVPLIPISQVCHKENSNVWQTTPSVYLSWVVGMGKEGTSGYLIEDLFVPFVSSPFARSVPKIIPMCDRPLVFICHGLWGWVRRVLHWGPICPVRLIPIYQVCAKDNSNVWQTTPSAYLSYVCGYQVKLSLKKVSIYRSIYRSMW